MYDLLIDAGKSRRTVQLVHFVIHRSLSQAVKLGILGRNPDDAPSSPKPRHKEMKILDQGQVHKLLIAAKTRGFRRLAFYHVALATGMRQGELLGLKWDDLDLTGRVMQIKRQMKRVPGGGFEFTPPKTKAGIRAIKLGKETVNILKGHYQIQLDESSIPGLNWQDYGLVFPSTVGTPINPRNVVRVFRKLLGDAGLPRIRFHDLRHTAASLMLNNGIDVLIVSKRLGRAKPSITLDIYGHLIPSSQEKAADLIDTLITPISIAGLTPTAPKLHQAEISAKNTPPYLGKSAQKSNTLGIIRGTGPLAQLAEQLTLNFTKSKSIPYMGYIVSMAPKMWGVKRPLEALFQ